MTKNSQIKEDFWADLINSLPIDFQSGIITITIVCLQLVGDREKVSIAFSSA